MSNKLIKKVLTEIDKLTAKQALKMIEMSYNEKGLRTIIGYWTVGAMEEDEDNEAELKEHLAVIRTVKRIK